MDQVPRYAALKSKYNNKYLCYVQESSKVQKYLQFSGECVISPYTKFEMQRAMCDPTLVNIRCFYNNKYLINSPSKPDFIIAGADRIEEDKSKSNCTLFQPLYDSTHKAFRFRHVYRDFNVCLERANPPYGTCLIARWKSHDKDLCDLCTIVDWEVLHAIPKYVCFKGNNDKFLRASWFRDTPYLEFSATDMGDPTTLMETFITKDGSIRFKSTYFGKFWRRSPNWIWADTTDTTENNPDTVFSIVRVDKKTIALRSHGNNNFLKRLTADGKTSCLNAAVSTIDATARLEMNEAVLSRDIYNVRFRTSDSIIYNERIALMATQTATNMTDVPNNMNMKLNYTETTTRNWSSSASAKLEVKTTLKAEVPFIFEGEINLSAEISTQYEWGKTETISKDLVADYQAVVPSKKTMIVNLIATKGMCNVPYSYTQRDTLITGEVKTYELDDGVYTGISCYKFHYDAKTKPLPA